MVLAAVDWYSFFFTFFAAIACVFAVAVLLTNNIVRMAFYLTLSLVPLPACSFWRCRVCGGDAADDLRRRHAGAVDFRCHADGQARFITMRTPSGEWVLSIIVGSALLFLLLVAAFGVEDWRTRARYGSVDDCGSANSNSDRRRSVGGPCRQAEWRSSTGTRRAVCRDTCCRL